MCILGRQQSPAARVVASADNRQANNEADLESRLRRRRAGAAANVLTSAQGIPATPKLGQPA
jgi:hypothetical protein